MSNQEILTQIRAPDRVARFPINLASAFARLLSVAKRRREARKSRALADSFNDHMLADIGLRRVHLTPRVDDLETYLDDRARISRF